MQKTNKTLMANLLLGLSVVFAVFATSAVAEDRPQSLVTGPRMVVIPWRSAAEIASEIDNAQADKTLAIARRVQAEGRRREIESAIETRKLSQKDVDRHNDDAKTGKRETEVVGLEIQSKAGQQAIDLLNRLKDIRGAEIDEAKAETELADAEIATLQMENQLLVKRTEYDSLSYSSANELTLATAQSVLGELEVRLLKLQQDQEGATQKLASKQRDIVDQRMKLHKAQLKLGMPRA